jgi:hypothetical protein
MAKTKYLTMEQSSVYTDDSGNFYPDIFTFNIENFQMNDVPLKYALSEQDIYRFDLLISNYYGKSDYDDLVLWVNNLEHIADKQPGDTIYLPSKNDITEYYRKNFISR